MSNLLPRDMKTRARREYHLRVVSVASFLLAASLLSAALLLAPSYLLVSSKANLAEATLSTKDTSMSDAYAKVVADIERANTLSGRLSADQNSASATQVLGEIEQEAGSTVHVGGIVLDRVEDGSYTVSLRGIADTRDALASFVDRLEMNPLIESAEVPFSDLAQARDAEFTASIKMRVNP